MDREPFVANIDELALICSARDHAPRAPGDARVYVQREIDGGMMCALPMEEIDDRLIVMIDAKARVGAFGFPHADEFSVIERHAGNRARVITAPGPIVSKGSWELCHVITAVNSVDGWGGPGVDGLPMSVTSLLQTMQNFEHRMAAS